MTIELAQYYKDKVTALLAAEKLPVADLPDTLDNFVVAIEAAVVVGVAGLEIYGNYGLLRSLVLTADYRSKGIAAKLLGRIEALAASNALMEIYLLTETAPGYFEGKGYRKIIRASVPAEVQRSSEFTHVCPQSASAMKKVI